MASNGLKRLILPVLMAAALVACSGSEPPATPVAAEGGGDAPAPGARALSIPNVGGSDENSGHNHGGPLVWDVPDSWTQVQPSSNMRYAQYSVSGSGGDGECVVFYFGPGQGGDPVANAQRWAGQFSQPDGSSSMDKMAMQDIEGSSLRLRLVEVTGTYEGGMGMGTAPAAVQPGWMLLGGIADGPDAPWFFKFTGPQATLEENREAFIGLMRSIRQEI